MNSIKKAGYRVYHTLVGLGVRCLSFPEQEYICGTDTLNRCGAILAQQNIKSVLIVCSKTVHKHGLLDSTLESLSRNNISYTIYEDISPNPTIKNVEDGLKLYTENKCKSIITVGGGSPMDCAKIIGLRAVSPKLSYKDMRSMLKINHRIPFMIAAPTTAGTGSESTAAAVISDPDNHDKYAIISPKLIPQVVILDGTLTVDLSPAFTASTGMDALTHAIEAYIGTIDIKEYNDFALESCRLIFENIQTAYHNPDNLEARNQMLIASNKAGLAFTKVYVGYVHSISHALSAIYNVAHGKTNAIVLPYVLEYYGKSIYKKTAHIARYCSIGDAKASDEVLTKALIEHIKSLNREFNIPSYVEELDAKEASLIVDKALKEANPSYPVPKVMDKTDCLNILNKLLK